MSRLHLEFHTCSSQILFKWAHSCLLCIDITLKGFKTTKHNCSTCENNVLHASRGHFSPLVTIVNISDKCSYLCMIYWPYFCFLKLSVCKYYRMGARCFWDSDTDNYAQDIYINVSDCFICLCYSVMIYLHWDLVILRPVIALTSE